MISYKHIFIFLLLISLFSTPVAADSDAEPFYLCEKTDSLTGEPIYPNSPIYDSQPYDAPLINLVQPIIPLIFIGIFGLGIFGAIYSTIKDARYTAEGKNDNPARYVRMRVKLIFAGVGIPVVFFVVGSVIEYITTYEYMCLVPTLF